MAKPKTINNWSVTAHSAQCQSCHLVKPLATAGVQATLLEDNVYATVCAWALGLIQGKGCRAKIPSTDFEVQIVL